MDEVLQKTKFIPSNIHIYQTHTCSRGQFTNYRNMLTFPPLSPSLLPSVLCYKYPLHTAGPATKAVISAVIRNLITVDMSASRLSPQLWNVTKSSFHAAHRFPLPPSVTAGTTSDAGNLETVV